MLFDMKNIFWSVSLTLRLNRYMCHTKWMNIQSSRHIKSMIIAMLNLFITCTYKPLALKWDILTSQHWQKKFHWGLKLYIWVTVTAQMTKYESYMALIVT